MDRNVVRTGRQIKQTTTTRKDDTQNEFKSQHSRFSDFFFYIFDYLFISFTFRRQETPRVAFIRSLPFLSFTTLSESSFFFDWHL